MKKVEYLKYFTLPIKLIKLRLKIVKGTINNISLTIIMLVWFESDFWTFFVIII